MDGSDSGLPAYGAPQFANVPVPLAWGAASWHQSFFSEEAPQQQAPFSMEAAPQWKDDL